MKKLDATYYIDQMYLFSKKENIKDGVKDYYLTGYYYFALELLERNGFLRDSYPYSHKSYLERSYTLYKASPSDCDLNPVAAIFGLLRGDKWSSLAIKDVFNRKPEIWPYYFSSKSIIYSILLYFYDIMFGFRFYFKKEKTMKDIVYILYRRSQKFNPVMWLIAKTILKPPELKKIIKDFFNVRKNMPPFDDLYVKLVDIYI